MYIKKTCPLDLCDDTFWRHWVQFPTAANVSLAEMKTLSRPVREQRLQGRQLQCRLLDPCVYWLQAGDEGGWVWSPVGVEGV